MSEPTGFVLLAALLLPVFGDYIPSVFMLPSNGKSKGIPLPQNSFGMIYETFLIDWCVVLVSLLASALTRFIESWRLPTTSLAALPCFCDPEAPVEPRCEF